MSRRSQRSRSSTSSGGDTMIPPSIRRGLVTLVKGNESYISRMLSVPNSSDGNKIVTKLEECMRMNQLSAELFLARFLDQSVLSVYASTVLHKSGKGSTATLAARIAKEWSKPTFAILDGEETTPPPSKKPRRAEDEACAEVVASPENNTNADEDDEDDLDWRKPLFYWKGKLQWINNNNNDSGDNDNNHTTFVWRGSWHSAVAQHGLPSSREFESTKDTNTFRLKGSAATTTSTTSSNPDEVLLNQNITALVNNEWILKGHYKLDQGDGNGPQKYRDKSHRLVFVQQPTPPHEPQKYLLAGACGRTEFGNFVSAGYAKVKNVPNNSNEKIEINFVLARRYIDEKDKRNALIKNGGARSVVEDYTKILSSYSSSSSSSSVVASAAAVDDGDGIVDPTGISATFWNRLLPRRQYTS